MPSRHFRKAAFADRILRVLKDVEEVRFVWRETGASLALPNAMWNENHLVRWYENGIPMEGKQTRCKLATADVPVPVRGDPVLLESAYLVRHAGVDYRIVGTEPQDNGIVALILQEDGVGP
jgi:hypothetical protein